MMRMIMLYAGGVPGSQGRANAFSGSNIRLCTLAGINRRTSA